MLFGNSACNAVCFIAFVINQLKLNGLTSGLSCPKVFALSARIMDDYLVCTIQYRFCRTIVLFKTNNLCGLKVLLKFKNIADICTAPTVNALIVVAHYANILMLFANKLNDSVLRVVCVLILVNKHISEFASIFLQDIRTFFEQFKSFKKQIVKIESVALF